MNTQVFTDSMVVDITNKNYLAKQIDIDDFDGIGIAQKYNISALPTILFFDCNGKILKRLEGLQYADMFIHQLFIHK
jgi:thioredoxin-related protein